MKDNREYFDQTLLEAVQSVFEINEEDFQKSGDDNLSFIDKRDLLVAFAGGLQTKQTFKELYEKQVEKKQSYNNISVEKTLEKFFSDFSSQVEWFISIFNSIHEGIMIADEECIVRFINHAYTKLTGVTTHEIIGRELSKVRPSARLPEVIKSGEPLYNVYRKVGAVEYIASMHPIIVQGKVIGGVTIATDITEIQNLSKKLTDYSKKVKGLVNRVKDKYVAKYDFCDILGISPEFKKVMNMAKKLSQTNINVLIQGESGTGKELFAHGIHNYSKRAQGPFVVVNCAAIPANLLESELFGYEAGSFTGANKQGKAGLVEIADEGTLFLDEIGEMSFDLQAKLLRFLQSMEFQRVGGTEIFSVDVRIIAATNRDLKSMVEEEIFREDLYYRLNASQLKIPPLRERKEDIEILINYFLAKFANRDHGPFTMAEDTKKNLLSYSWPGNIRELENTIDFLTSISNENIITVASLPDNFFHDSMHHREEEIDLEKQALIDALKIYGKNVIGKKKAAKHLGISLATLYNKLKYYKIEHF
ncbi:sigma-54 interaction domain-containing protein [Desulfitobacterium sp. AusDCA]|uniref:sigma-54 interaction domain-containing protein n=1 Tax=Desulfitobacterium sp. AusDCA TaxID=3240383 RepID=UPI003DA6E594